MTFSISMMMKRAQSVISKAHNSFSAPSIISLNVSRISCLLSEFFSIPFYSPWKIDDIQWICISWQFFFSLHPHFLLTDSLDIILLLPNLRLIEFQRDSLSYFPLSYSFPWHMSQWLLLLSIFNDNVAFPITSH